MFVVVVVDTCLYLMSQCVNDRDVAGVGSRNACVKKLDKYEMTCLILVIVFAACYVLTTLSQCFTQFFVFKFNVNQMFDQTTDEKSWWEIKNLDEGKQEKEF